MPNQPKDNLFALIKSLTKAEKRYFSLYISRQKSSESARYSKLFNLLDKSDHYDEEQIFKKEKSIRRSQLHNLKAHLYNELLTALRLFHGAKNLDIQIREQIDFAKILYNRGLVLQSLKVLDKAKSVARQNSHFILTLEILQFEQAIESRHITRSIKGRAEMLHQESNYILNHVNEVAQLASLALRLYGSYLENGHVTNGKQSRELETFFKNALSNIHFDQESFYGRAYLHQAHCWYYFIQLDFSRYYLHAYKWVKLFSDSPKAKTEEPFLYLKGLHNLVTALFMTGKHDELRKGIEELELFHGSAANYNENLQVQCFIYLYTAKLNYFFLTGRFTKGITIVDEIEQQLNNYRRYIDTHRIMVFYYKIACLYFGAGDSEKAIDYLNKIINLKVGHLRSDLQCVARLLHLIAHYELGNTDILEYLIKSVYRFFAKMENKDAVQEEILKFLKRSLSPKPKDVIESFSELKRKLDTVSKDKFANRSYQYLDISSWLESKIEGVAVEKVIREKFLRRIDVKI